MNSRNFKHINESFKCDFCGEHVKPLSNGGCRNHCPFCLNSRHVDIKPGDRKNTCHGQLKAVGYELNSKKGLVLKFRCLTCGALTRNKSAADDSVQPDDYKKILALTPHP